MEAFRFPIVFYFILFYTLIAKIYMWYIHGVRKFLVPAAEHGV